MRVKKISFSYYVKAIIAFIGTIIAVLFLQATGVLRFGWSAGEKNEKEDDDLDLNTTVKRKALPMPGLQGQKNEFDYSARELMLAEPYLLQKRALSNETQATLIEGTEAGQFSYVFDYITSLDSPFQQMLIQGNDAFLINSQGNVSILDISNNSNPILLSNYSSICLFSVQKQDNYLFLTGCGIAALDITNRRQPLPVDIFSPNDLIVQSMLIDNKLYYSDTVNRIDLISTSRPISVSTRSLFEYFAYVMSGDISGMTVSNRYAFITNVNLGLLIHDPQRFFKPSRIDIPGIVSGMDKVGNVLFLAGGQAGLKIFDVSDYSAPNELGAYPVKNATDVCVSEGIAFLAADDEGMLIFNVSDLSRPTFLSFYNASHAYKVAHCGKNVICLSSDKGGVEFINVTNLQSPEPLSHLLYPAQSFWRTIKVVRDRMFASPNNTGTLQIDISNPSVPRIVYIEARVASDDVDATEELMCTVVIHKTDESYNFLGIYSISPRNIYSGEKPLYLGPYQIPRAKGVWLFNKIAYVKTDNTLVLIDLTDPLSPVPIETYFFPETLIGIKVVNGIAYAIVFNPPTQSTVVIMAAPFWQTRVPIPDSAMRAVANDDYVFVSDAYDVVHTYNLSDISSPKEVAQYEGGYQINDMALSDDFLYLAQFSRGTQVVDIFNPSSPKFAGLISRPNNMDSLANVVNNKKLHIADVVNGFRSINLQEKVVIVNCQLKVNQGQTVTITLDDIAARDTRQKGFHPDMVFFVSNAKEGQFVFANNTNQAISQFTQQNVIDGLVQYKHFGSSLAPSYEISAKFGAITTPPMEANITFSKVYEMPTLLTNAFAINQDELITLTAANFNATVKNGDSSQIVYTVNSIGNLRYQLTKEPGVFITQFTKGQLDNKEVQVQHLGGPGKPFCRLSVSYGPFATSFESTAIDYDAAPQIINNKLDVGNGETVEITAKNFLAIDMDSANETLLWRVSNVTRGIFFSINNASEPLSNFTQGDVNKRLIRFKHDGSGIAPSYFASVSDGRITIDNQEPTVLFNLKNNVNNIPVVTGSTVAGVGLLGSAGVVGMFAVRHQRNQATRKDDPFADYIRKAIGLSGVDDFKSALGQRYVTLINDSVIPEFVNEGIHINSISIKKQKYYAASFALVAKMKTVKRRSCFCRSEITVDDLAEKYKDIVQTVARLNKIDLGDGEGEYQLLLNGDDDDTEGDEYIQMGEISL